MTAATKKAASSIEAENAKAGAKAGAKARRREAEEAAAQSAAVLQVAADGRSATWTHSYRVGGEIRESLIRETGRVTVEPRELLAMVGEACRLAGDRLASRRNIPTLSHDERQDLRSELVARLLTDHGGEMPRRDRLSRSYLVKRAEGIVMDDPERANIDAASEGIDPEAIAAAAEGKARDRHDSHDPMLNRGVDGSWPEVEVGAAIYQRETGEAISQRAQRTAEYLIGGGTVRGDWSEVWQTSEGYAATRLVPEGAAQLRDHLSSLDQSPLYLAVKAAGEADRDDLDRLDAARRAIESGLTEAPRKPRSVPERRWRADLPPELHAEVVTRTDRRIIIRSERTRKLAAAANGWTASTK
jgi:2-hydroxychromene-2-carboxylate isomerase